MCNKPVSPPQDIVADKPDTELSDLPNTLALLAEYLRQQKMPAAAEVVEEARAAIRRADTVLAGAHKAAFTSKGYPTVQSDAVEAYVRQARFAPISVDGLREPEGWFLYRAAHQHTDVLRLGDTHRPIPRDGGPYSVQFQRYLTGGLLTEGRGHTLIEAWANACEAVAHREVGFRRSRGQV